VLFIRVRADDPSPVQEPVSEVKYAAIGIGVGIFLSVCFLAIKIYMIKRHMLDNEQSEDSIRVFSR
ncbi:transmembrane protein, partial [Clarias magur]